MAWSHDLLSSEEQRLFAELGVFAGSVTLKAVAAVAMSTMSPRPALGAPDDVIEQVASLCDKSLLTRRDADDGEPRLAMLETVREFAREQLAAGEHEAAVRRRHAHWFATAAAIIGDETGSPARARALGRVQADLDDALAALEWSTESPQGDAIDALHIAGGLTMFWHWSGLWREGRRWAERALTAADRAAERRGESEDASRAPAELEPLGRTLQAAHLLSWTLGEPGESLAYAERAIRIWATLEATPGEPAARMRAAHWATYTHCVVAFSHLALGDVAAAVHATDAGVAAAHRAGGEWIIGFSLGWRAMLHTTLGQQELARADLGRAARGHRSGDDAARA